jgi:hypothetical protein
VHRPRSPYVALDVNAARCQVAGVTSIAGEVPVDQVMAQLAATRPVFHSEADFQFAFGQALSHMSPGLHVRLEVPRRRADTGRSEYLDLLAFGGQGRTAIELKYPTAAWHGRVRVAADADEEEFDVRSHDATDLARHGFVHDIYRLEQTEIATHGLAVLLTNVADLWTPKARPKPTRDQAFRIHEGQRLTGELIWGPADYPRNDRTLRGGYSLTWHDYSHLDGATGRFRWLGVETNTSDG